MADGEQSISTGAGSVLAAALVARRPTASPPGGPGQGSELGAGARCREQGLQSLVFYTLYSPPVAPSQGKKPPRPSPQRAVDFIISHHGNHSSHCLAVQSCYRHLPNHTPHGSPPYPLPPRCPFQIIAEFCSGPLFSFSTPSSFFSPSCLSPLASPSLLSLRRRRSYDARHRTTRHETRRFLRGRSHRPFCTSPLRSGPSQLRLRICTRRYKATNSAT